MKNVPGFNNGSSSEVPQPLGHIEASGQDELQPDDDQSKKHLLMLR